MIVGCDVGFGHVKTVTANGLDDFPAVVAPYEAEGFGLPAAFGSGTRSGLRYRGGTYLVGTEALRWSARRWVSLDRDWVGSEVYRVLALTALHRRVPHPGAEVRLVTGLPVGDLDRHGEGVRAALVGHHTIERLPSGEPWEVTVAEVRVMPQPFGTLLALVLDDAGDLRDPTLGRGRLGIIDIGFRTTDYLTVDGLTTLSSRSLSRNTGMVDVLLDVSRAIQSHYGLALDPHEVDEAVLRGTICLSGQDVRIQPMLDPLLEDHAKALAGHATMLWGRGQALQAILVTGGGGQLLGPHLASLGPHVRVVPNARVQNAIGYYRYGRRLVGPGRAS